MNIDNILDNKMEKYDIKVEFNEEFIIEDVIKSEPLDTFEEDNLTVESSVYPVENSFNKFDCNICFKVFEDPEDLKVHQTISHSDKPYTCDICSTKYGLLAHLNEHMLSHEINSQSLREQLMDVTEIQSSSGSNLNRISENLLENNHKTIIQRPYDTDTERNLKKKVLKTRVPENKSFILTGNNYINAPQVNLNENVRRQVTLRPKQVIFKPLVIAPKEIRNFTLFQCSNCVFNTMSRNQYLHHQSNCNIELNNHTEQAENTPGFKINISYRCELCQRLFPSHCALNGHMNYHKVRGELTNKKNYSVKQFNFDDDVNDFITSENVGVKNANNITKSYTCDECGRKFLFYNKFCAHRDQHKKKMICTICRQQFFFKKNFEKHKRKHVNFEEENRQNKNYSLHVQNVSKKSNYHKVALKKTPYNKTNSSINGLSHLAAIKKFICLHCKINFDSVENLKRHYIKFHPTESTKYLVPCSWCNVIISKNNLLRHVRNFHPEVKPINCPYCHVKFKYHASMKVHIASYHDSDE